MTAPQWLADYQRQRQQQVQHAQDEFMQLIEELAHRQVVRVELIYDGYGDSGAIEEILALDASGQPVELPQALRQQLTAAAEEILPAGWENNEGAFGQLVLDIPARKLTRQHNWRVESTDYDEEVFGL